jgi:hypothetical protein
MPNPFENKLLVRIITKTITAPQISLWNTTGSIVLSQKSEAFVGLKVVEIDAMCLPSGIYLLKIQFGQGEKIIRVVKI